MQLKMSTNESMISSVLPVRLTSVVVRGFGRGSKELGIPTANICKDNLKCAISFDDLPTGIYWGYTRIIHTNNEEESTDDTISSLPSLNGVYMAAVSIGYNPVYGNQEKTIEPHLIATSEHPMRKSSKCEETQFGDFYGSDIRLSIVGYLRPELPFEGLDKLIEAIKQDIVDTEILADRKDSKNLVEKEWVESNNLL